MSYAILGGLSTSFSELCSSPGRYILPKSQKGADAKSEGDTTVKDKENDAPKEALWICQVMSGDRGDVSIL